MHVAPCYRSRQIVGALAKGEALVDALRVVCQEHQVRSGTVSATGILSHVELDCLDEEGRFGDTPLRLRGLLQLVHCNGLIAELNGRLDVALTLVLSRLRDDGLQLVSGTCRSARVKSVEFVVTCFDDVLLRRSTDFRTGIRSLTDIIAAHPVIKTDGPVEPADEEPVPSPFVEGGASHALSASATIPGEEPAPENGRRTAARPLSHAPRDGANGRPHPARAVAPAHEEPEPCSAPRDTSTQLAAPTDPPAPSTPDAAHPEPSTDEMDADQPTGRGASPSAERPLSWDDAVRLSDPGPKADRPSPEGERPEPDDYDDDGDGRNVQIGDILKHKKFGPCVVQRVDSNQEYATVRLRNNRLVRLNLEVLQMVFEGVEDGHQVFVAAPSTDG